MLNYKLLALNDFSQGITDNYKSAGIKSNKLENFIIRENGSIQLRNGLALFDRTVGSNTRAMTDLGDKVVSIVGDSIEYKDSASQKLTTFPAGAVFANAVADTTGSIHKWRNSTIANVTSNDKALRTVEHDDGVLRTEVASLPPVLGASLTGGTGSDRLVAVCTVREYTDVDGFSYKEYSPEYITTSGGTSGNLTVEVTPAQHQITDTEYNLNYLGLAVFVTEPNGSTFFFANSSPITAPPSNTSVIVDLALDYTANEVGFFLSEEPKGEIPISDYMAIVNNTTWCLSVYEDATTKYKYRLRQSVQGMPTSMILSAYRDLEFDGRGIGGLNNTPIVLTEGGVFRIEGSIGIDGSGNIRPVRILNSEGGISHNSIVVANDRMYYAGTDGFYVTDGYKATNITSSELYKSYSDAVKDRSKWDNIYGTFDRDNDLIYWIIDTGKMFVYNIKTNGFSTINLEAGYNFKSLLSIPSEDQARVTVTDTMATGVDDATHRRYTLSLTNSRFLISGAEYKVRESGVIYTGEIEGVNYNENTAVLSIDLLDSPPASLPSASVLYESGDEVRRVLIVGTDRNFTVQSHPLIFSDLSAGAGLEPTEYGRQPIEFDWLSAGMNYGNSSSSKWVQFMTTNLKLATRVAMEPYTVRENDLNSSAMKLISNLEQFKAYDENDIWGRRSAQWFPNNIVTQKRHMPKGFCRCRFNQVGLRNTPAGIYNSIDYQNVEVIAEASTSITVAINSKEGNPMRFPYDLKGNTIKLKREAESAFTSKALKILDQSDDRTTLDIVRQPSDPYQIGDTLDWIVFGSPLEQSFEVMGVTLRYADLSDSGDGYKRSNNMESRYE